MNEYPKQDSINQYSPISNIPAPILEKRAIVHTVSNIGIVLLLYLLLSATVPLLQNWIIQHWVKTNYTDYGQIITQSLSILTFAIVYLIPTVLLYYSFQGYRYRIKKMCRIPNRTILIASIPMMLSVFVVTNIGISNFTALLNHFHIYVLQPAAVYPNNPVALILYGLSSTIVPAFFEEVLFHGVILYALRRHGDTFALILSSVLFAIMHGNLPSAMNAFIMGLVIGYFVIRTGSLLTGMLLHFINNGMVLFLNWIQLSMDGNQTIVYMIYIICLLIGSLSLIILVNRDPNLFVVYDKKTYFNNSEKIRYAFGNIFMIGVIICCCFQIFSTFTII